MKTQQMVDHHCSCRKLQASVLLLAQRGSQKIVSLMHVYIYPYGSIQALERIPSVNPA